jgi:hypothetical protein
MVDAYRYLTEETALVNGETVARNWGDIWLGCLQAFVEFQRATGFPEGGSSFPPATDVWPCEIAMWMKGGRHWKDVELADKERFGQQWWDWWCSLQPKSRVPTDHRMFHSISPTVDMDWSDLRKPGRNGFLLIMIVLVWWGKASNREGSWLKAVADVFEVLTCIQKASKGTAPKNNPLCGSSAANAAGTVTSKRGCRGDEAGPSKKKCKVR